MVIPAIWDVFWDPTEVKRTLVRAPNTLSQKNRHPKKKFLAYFRPIFSVRKIGQNQPKWKEKIFELFFSRPFMTIIPAIWDVFWDQTDLLTILVRPPNTLSQKSRYPKKKFFAYFWHIFSVRKIGQNQPNGEGKIFRTFFSNFFQK